MLSSCVVPSFQRHKLPVLGPPAWIGHRDSVWHARMNATLILYQNATNATPKACLLDSAGLPRGGHFLQFLFYFFPFLIFLNLFFSHSFTLKANKASACLRAMCCVYISLIYIHSEVLHPSTVSLPLFVSHFFLPSLHVTQCNCIHKNTNIA